MGALASIIIPVFNGEAFIAEAIRSALTQDHDPVEIIVIDDGSTDGSADIAASIPDVRLIQQDNKGPAAARNAGLDIATGEFIGFLDADDVMLPHKLSTQIGYLMDHQRCGLVLTRQEILVEPGVEVPAMLAPFATKPIYQETDVIRAIALSEAQPLSLVARRSVFERVGQFDPNYRMSEDMDWLFRAQDAGVEMALVPEVLLRRRMPGANLTYDHRAIPPTFMRLLKQKAARKRGDPPA